MTTLTVIAIAAAVSVPVIQQAMRDRQLQEQAITFMNVFREARSRATFRYAAQLVRVDLTGTRPLEQIVEGTQSSCMLSTYPLTNLIYENIVVEQNPDITIANTSPSASYIEFCYTPSGRMFYRFDPGGVFTEDNGATAGRPLSGGFLYTVSNTTYPGTVVRRVAIPLGGSPRFAQ